ncbi:hypothetical protein LMB21_05360 [Limosilactobacillus reuteri]|nr:hypothetical protein [Limosilactobacillus reuteri]MCC4366730.1 hypothetical protein [Limosilactobacillus reuteri]
MIKESTVNSNNQSKIETIHASIDPKATEEEREEIIKWIENLKKQKQK